MCDSMIGRVQMPAVSVPQLVEMLCRCTGVPAQDILSGQQDRYTAHARFRVMEALRRRDWSLHQIGRALNRHHTAVLHGLNRFDELNLERIAQ